MIQCVLASHGNYAREALNSAKMICGLSTENVHILSIQEGGEGIAKFEKDATALAEKLIDAPVLIMTDLFGGSPFMTLLSSFRNNDYKCIAGFNPPMHIELLQSEGIDLAETAQTVLETGRDVSIRLIDKIIVEDEEND